MIDISMLYCDYRAPSAPHRYGRSASADAARAHVMRRARSASERRPIVVWNITRTCNLRCIHCYSDSEATSYPDELTTAEAKAVIDDLADFGVPAVLFSGGEPLTRPDLFELVRYAGAKKLHTVLSTNGTLINLSKARQIKEAGFVYVGLSLDSAVPEVHDHFRGQPGAFERTIRGLRHLVAAGQKVGLRLTLSRPTAENLDAVFDLIERERINRACFYHLVPAGRGQKVLDLSSTESRQAVDVILERTRQFHQSGKRVEILTVDNHCDGPYLYLKMLADGDSRAREVYDLLKWNGGGLNSSGVGIGCIDWTGHVHPDQFWTHYSLGNVRHRRFSEVWADTSDPLMAGLKVRKPLLKGRCGRCKFVDLCGGALRVRAELITGDAWAAEPACYLTDEEIGLSPDDVDELKAKGEYLTASTASPTAMPADTLSDRPCTE